MLKGIFGCKTEVTAGCRKYHNETCSLHQILIKDDIGWALNTHGIDDKRILNFRKLEGNRPFGTRRNRRDKNIKIDLKEKKCDNIFWIHLAQDRRQ
jgi:hypothetical protein